jgi:hypothetical protein
MGNILYSDFNEDECLSITIQLPKSCYYPGEMLYGKIILQVKTNKISPTFNFPQAIITITQYQQYKFYLDNILITQKDKKVVLTQPYSFKKYKNRPILIPLSLSFNIQIPTKIDPTLLHEDTNFIKHYLSIDFPQIKCKKSIGLIIQNRQKFCKDNGLLKTTIEKFNDIHKSIFFQKNSKIAFLFKTDKNSYAYNELIPYEIIMNLTESELIIEHLRVSLSRNIYFGDNDKIDSKIILMKKYILHMNNKNKIFKISGHFLFPVISDYFSVNPMNVYNYFNKKVINDFDKNCNDVNLFPTCFSSLFICSYFLNLEIIFKSFFTKNETVSIPIELYTPLKIDDIEKNFNDIKIKNKEEKENMLKNEQTPGEDDTNTNSNCDSYNNIINIENEINNLDYCDNKNDFEIINMEDFYRILTDEKQNKLIS